MMGVIPGKVHKAWLLRALIIGLLFGLTACGTGNIRPSDETAALQDEYGMIIVAHTDGMFMVDGAVLTGGDLVSHVAYLESQGRLPETVLLKDGDASDIRTSHLRDFSVLQSTYGFSGFVEYDGDIEPLKPLDED